MTKLHPNPLLSPLSNSVKAVRIRCNMTQEQLARRIGVTRQTVMSIEIGRTTPSIFLAYRLAAVLNVSVTELFSVR
jgi:putative transcriptional regulator